jgi:hypothetical protein
VLVPALLRRSQRVESMDELDRLLLGEREMD